MSSEVTNDKVEKELLLARKQLNIIRNISTELNRPMGLKAKLDNILTVLDEQFGLSHCMVLIPDEIKKTLSVFASRGYPETSSTIPYGKGIAGIVAQKKVHINITGLLRKMQYMAVTNNNNNASIDLPGLSGAQSQIAIPLLSNNELVAVLMAESTASSVFGIEDEKFLLTLTHPIAVSIQNSILFDTMEERIKDRTAELERINHTKDKLFSIISHDLRSPVTSFQSITQLLKYYSSRGETHKIEGLQDKIEQSVSRLNFLLDNLLNWSLSQGGSISCKYEIIYLEPFLNDIFALYSDTLTSKNISLKVEIQPGESVIADLDTLSVIYRNLLSNAVKFTSKNGSIIVSTHKKNEVVSICIEDTGIGMQKEQVEALFTLSGKKSTIGTEKERGTGLGLVLVHEFVLLNNGKITVESTPGKGTRFITEFPSPEL